ncbi:MAG: HAD-IB family hydrolase [Dethiosulfatibacter sp.]|nr:HAD-IB family hydrolase [Dethiosulfatibacter sp.]
MGNIAAFFDIDGTLYREGLITATFKMLVKSEIIDQERWYNEVKEKYTMWDKRIGNYDDYLLKMAEIYVEAVKGLHKAQIEHIAKKVVTKNGGRVYTFTRDRIRFHKEAGHKIITISGSPEELVEQMSLMHGFDDFIGTKYIKDEDDFFTGEIVPMWDSANKEKEVMDFVSKYDIDLQQSYAYGDTAGDLSMFKMVGHPTAVNPTKELLTKISQVLEICNKTKVAVERKDMIYQFDMSFFDLKQNQ